MLKIKDIYSFQDIVICALRYALGRKTYITDSVAEFIKEYPEIINERVKMVMLRDLNEYIDKRRVFCSDDECDYRTWLSLKEWLECIDVTNANANLDKLKK